ncbi:hypothetical protein SAMN00120144_3134 [Hymenobacter roseosalivarius DSM 11622]|uniref:Uncharacterized protein n=1 Tax=Hymenobacter roseosalivarius DSM 11622 TaxID=645990 RepID=A0A1W1UF64_9BACT|nr:hypothetical protein [Hymenobacter roseosalivarius]SMB79424.1 hypothetical protein SAMN00120144_3134 [Hymenobacter roseosalivarius DSM 11622]
MRAVEAPTLGDLTWNQYRSQVINAITAVEAQMHHLRKSINTEGMTYEVAGLLKIEIIDQEDFDVLSALVKAVRHVGREAIRATKEDHGGQFSLRLL